MPRKTKPGYENLRQKAERKQYTLIDPLDYLILDALPEEGELVMGYYPLVQTTDDMSKERFKGALTSLELAQQLRNMNIQGLVTKVKTRGARSGWQRTKEGARVVNEWKANNDAPDMSGGKDKK